MSFKPPEQGGCQVGAGAGHVDSAESAARTAVLHGETRDLNMPVNQFPAETEAGGTGIFGKMRAQIFSVNIADKLRGRLVRSTVSRFCESLYTSRQKSSAPLPS